MGGSAVEERPSASQLMTAAAEFISPVVSGPETVYSCSSFVLLVNLKHLIELQFDAPDRI